MVRTLKPSKLQVTNLTVQYQHAVKRANGRENKIARRLRARLNRELDIENSIKRILHHANCSKLSNTWRCNSNLAMLKVDVTPFGRFVSLELRRAPYYRNAKLDWVEIVATVPNGRYTLEESVWTFRGIAYGILLFGGLIDSQEFCDGVLSDPTYCVDGELIFTTE